MSLNDGCSTWNNETIFIDAIWILCRYNWKGQIILLESNRKIKAHPTTSTSKVEARVAVGLSDAFNNFSMTSLTFFGSEKLENVSFLFLFAFDHRQRHGPRPIWHSQLSQVLCTFLPPPLAIWFRSSFRSSFFPFVFNCLTQLPLWINYTLKFLAVDS